MRTVLQFSGGKDSLACLYLLKPRWNDLTVVWVNTGAAFPETLALMERVQQMVPHFHEVRSRQNIEEEGYPTDVVPLAATSWGHFYEASHGLKFQSRYSCCGAALWGPTQRAMREMGATTIIRGQKRSDAKKSPIRSGQIIDGVRYEFPLESWTDADVLAYLAEIGVDLPANYAGMSTGLDCWNCTAYLSENAGRLAYMAERHPDKHRLVKDVLLQLDRTLRHETQPLRDSL